MRRSYGAWRLFSSIFLICPIFAFTSYEVPADWRLLRLSEKIARSQLGVREEQNNSGEVEKYLWAVGLGRGNPYCAAGVYWCFAIAADSLSIGRENIPVNRTAVANEMYNHSRKIGTKVKRKIRRHDLLVWKSKRSWKGHIERAISNESKGIVRTIGFNVKLDKGEGVGIKTRFMNHPIGKLMYRGAITFRGVGQ